MRPGGLTAVCVIGLCLAVLGLCSSAWGCLGIVFQSMFQEFATQMQQGMPGAGAQLQMQQDLMAVQARWQPYVVANVVLNGVASSLLLVGAILGLRLSSRTNFWFVPALACATLHAVLYVVLQAGMQHEMQSVMARQMAQMMQQGGAAAPGGAAVMSGTMRMMSAIGIAFAGGWALLQIVYYATALWYLLQRSVRSLFTPPTLEALAAEPTVGSTP